MITHQQMFILTCLAVVFSIAPERLNAASDLSLDQRVQDALNDNADLRAAEEHHHEATQAGSAQMEAGPATIDVSAYPKAVQDSYLLFTEKCA